MNPYVLSTALPTTALEICQQLGIEAELFSDGELLVYLDSLQEVTTLCELVNENPPPTPCPSRTHTLL